MALQELDKVLSIKFYAEVTKRNRDDDELESLKIMQSAIEWVFKREKLFTGHCALEGVSQLKRNASQNYTSCTEGLPSLIQATRIELLCMK